MIISQAAMDLLQTIATIVNSLAIAWLGIQIRIRK